MILIDNTVLSNFALTGTLTLLKDYCGEGGATTPAVLAEYEQGVVEGYFSNVDLQWLQKVDIEAAGEKALLAHLRSRLGAGEASCLAIAIHRKYDLLTDDMAVRKTALREGVRLSGSIGVLLELVRTEKIDRTRGNEILKGFIRHGFYSPVDRLDELT